MDNTERQGTIRPLLTLRDVRDEIARVKEERTMLAQIKKRGMNEMQRANHAMKMRVLGETLDTLHEIRKSLEAQEDPRMYAALLGVLRDEFGEARVAQYRRQVDARIASTRASSAGAALPMRASGGGVRQRRGE